MDIIVSLFEKRGLSYAGHGGDLTRSLEGRLLHEGIADTFVSVDVLMIRGMGLSAEKRPYGLWGAGKPVRRTVAIGDDG